MKMIGHLIALAALVPAVASAEQAHHSQGAATSLVARTPTSISEEHREIHAVLERAMREPGELGAAARALEDVLAPHFRREEEIATPPLGLLGPLSHGPATQGMRAVLPMTEALERELPRMLKEHQRIGAARERFEAAARRADKAEYIRFAETLAHHARQEEEVLYPAAVIVGRYVGATTKPTPPPHPRAAGAK